MEFFSEYYRQWERQEKESLDKGKIWTLTREHKKNFPLVLETPDPCAESQLANTPVDQLTNLRQLITSLN